MHKKETEVYKETAAKVNSATAAPDQISTNEEVSDQDNAKSGTSVANKSESNQADDGQNEEQVTPVAVAAEEKLNDNVTTENPEEEDNGE